MYDNKPAEPADATPIATAPIDRWIEVRTIESDFPDGDGGYFKRPPAWHRMRWWPEGDSWVEGHPNPVVTGVWTDDDGWLQPDEVDAWRECQE